MLQLSPVMRCLICSLSAALLALTSMPTSAQISTGSVLTSGDLSRLRSIGSVTLSPDGRYVAYTITMRDQPGRPAGQLWVMDLSSQKSVRLGGDKPASAPLWSADSKWIAFHGSDGDKSSLLIAHPDGSGATALALLAGTNSPLPDTGREVAWSPDGKQIAFLSSTPDDRAAEASGDPMVITRYLYKPDYGEGLTRFNDNQRLHIFVVDIATKKIRQLTQGNYDEHSIDWSPDGKQLVFASNREPNQDEFFNYDLFTLQLADNTIHRLTATEYCEYAPRWSPDGKSIVYLGTRRGLTDRETTMEDTHVWLMKADGSNRREIGNILDNRQGAPQWSPDGRAVYLTVH
jgi:Tol biopolymer transport system component